MKRESTLTALHYECFDVPRFCFDRDVQTQYYARLMSGWPVVDSIQFARLSGKLSGLVQVSELKRLAGVALDDAGGFQVGLEGFQDSDARPCLRLRVQGTVNLACQRCLEPVLVELASERRFVLVECEDKMMDLADEDEAIESLMADNELDALTLAEDEILLQIPIAPKHDPKMCTPPEWAAQGRNGGNAFSVLGTLTDTKD
jgi:uncharacterized protein